MRNKNIFKKEAFTQPLGSVPAHRRPARAKAGFTLWELMIAAAISALAIGSLLAAFIGCVALSETNNNRVIAAADAQGILEDIKSLSFSDIDSYSPPTLTNLENENIVFTVSLIGSNVKEVTVDVSWTHKQHPETFRLSTRVAR